MARIFVLSGASGAGKSTIAQACAMLNERVVLIVKGTTRPDRPGEANPDCVYDPDFATRYGDAEKFLVYQMNQNFYSIELVAIKEVAESGQCPAVIVTDAATIERLRALFPGKVVVVFVHRDRSLGSVRELVRARLIATTGLLSVDLEQRVEADVQARWAAREMTYDQLASGELRPDHVVFNNGTITQAVNWMLRIIGSNTNG